VSAVCLNLLANENMPARSVALLRQHGHDIWSGREDGPGTALHRRDASGCNGRALNSDVGNGLLRTDFPQTVATATGHQFDRITTRAWF
jgi:hypothetical protein